MSAHIAVRCTPFCQPCAKGYKHHDLLVALLNTESACREREHEHLAKMIKKHEALGWDRNEAILEKNVEFRFPLLHWACVLGKQRTVQWLLRNGFSPTVQCAATKETALHRVLLTLPEFEGNRSGRQIVFDSMLGLLKDCLAIGDHRQHTPLHITARHMLKMNKAFSGLYENFMHGMISEIEKMPHDKQQLVLNATDNTGDTVLHILAESDKSLAVIKSLLAAGATAMTPNKLNITPLDVAKKFSAVNIFNLLKKTLLEGCGRITNDFTGDVPLSSSKERRSERRVRLLSGFRLSPDYATYSDFDTSSEGSVDVTQLSDDLQPEKADADVAIVTSSTVGDTIIVKQEPDAEENETCHCLQSGDNQGTSIEISDTEEPNVNQPSAEEEATNLSLIQMIEEAGVFPKLNVLVRNTKEQHSSKLENLDKSIREAEMEFEEQEDKHIEIQQDILRLKKELESKTKSLSELCENKDRISQKRKLLRDESTELKKKMKCCETLLKSVSKNLDN